MVLKLSRPGHCLNESPVTPTDSQCSGRLIVVKAVLQVERVKWMEGIMYVMLSYLEEGLDTIEGLVIGRKCL